MTEFERYFTGIYDGKIVACEKMKQIAERLLEQYADPGEYHFDYDIANRHIGFIEDCCRQPSGKIGEPLNLQLFQKARLQAIFGFVDDNNLRQFNEVLIIEGRKNGKALSLDTDIPTPGGFIKMRDISVGDKVYGSDGSEHLVTCVSEVFQNHECYRVTFRGGFSVVCDAGHIWRVKTKKGKIVDKPIEDLLHFSRIRKDGKGTEYLFRVPVCKPVQYSEKKLPIDPYTFGVWLGDGSSSDARITVSDEDLAEMMANIQACGHTVKVYNNKDRAKSIGIDVVGKGRENKFLSSLRELGVAGNKHIPDIYLHSSVEQRQELLRGLMDTDGTCEKHGQCEFSQKKEIIIDQVRELLSSLGIVSSKRDKTIMCNGRECKSFSVLFFVDKAHSCFRMKRKHNRLKDVLNARMLWNSIIDISKVPSVPCKCLAVDSPDHLYLATRNYIVTHNTTETSCVELDMLVNDGEGSPQIYNIATKKDQAKLGYDACAKMVLQSPLLRKHINKRAYDLYYAKNLGYIKPLCSDTNGLDGLDVHCGVIDELAAIKNRDVYDIVKQGMGARSQPLLFCITTNGFIRNGIFDKQYEYAAGVLDGNISNSRFLPFIYELDSADEWDNPECWLKANPGLGTIKKESFLRECVQKAKDDPSFKPTVLVKDFNVKQTAEAAWLRYEDTVSPEVDLDGYRFDYCIGGFDAADTTDLNAATAICKRPGDEHIYRLSMYWIPEQVLLDEDKTGNRRGRDAAPYRLWIDQGWMRTCPGNKCDKHIFLDWFRELKYSEDLYPAFIGFDPWHISDELLAEFKGEFGPNAMIPVRQGVLTLSEPMKNIKADLQARRIVFDNPIDQWCLINTQCKTDVNGNIQPVKSSDPTQRIDGTAAFIDAYRVLMDHEGEYINLNEEAN